MFFYELERLDREMENLRKSSARRLREGLSLLYADERKSERPAKNGVRPEYATPDLNEQAVPAQELSGANSNPRRAPSADARHRRDKRNS